MCNYSVWQEVIYASATVKKKKKRENRVGCSGFQMEKVSGFKSSSHGKLHEDGDI